MQDYKSTRPTPEIIIMVDEAMAYKQSHLMSAAQGGESAEIGS
jgi:hypothetical protein